MKFKSKFIVLYFFIALVTNSVNASKTVFLTGAAGFIGSNFLEYMFNKYPDYNFIVLDNLTYAGNLENIPKNIISSKRFDFFYGSVTNQILVDDIMSRANLVVHFAAESHVTNSIYEDNLFFDTDVNGTRVMMRSLIKHSKTVERFIHISTSEVYGTALTEPIDEEHPLNPKSPYAAAKTGADRLVYAYWCTYNIPVTILRPFNNYGQRQHLEKFIPWLISSAILGKSLTVHGDGSQTRDWLHVKDTCAAIDKALHINDFEKIKNQVINIGTGKKVSILDIAKKILEHFKLSEDKLEFTKDRPGQVQCHISSTEKAKNLLQWESKISFDEGIENVIEWYKNNIDSWKKNIEMVSFMGRLAFKKNRCILLEERI